MERTANLLISLRFSVGAGDGLDGVGTFFTGFFVVWGIVIGQDVCVVWYGYGYSTYRIMMCVFR